MRTTEIISFSVSPEFKKELAEAAKNEHRTLSEFLREAARFYMKHRRYELAHEIVSKKLEESGVTIDDIEAEVDELRREK